MAMDKRTLKRKLVGEFSWKRLVRSTLISLGIIYVALSVYAYFTAEKYLFQPQRAFYKDTPQILKLTSGSGIRISARYLPNPKATFTILYSHGNAEDIGLLRSTFQQIHDMGFSVFAYDFRGFGTSEGRPSEQGAYEDITAAYNYLTVTLHIPLERILALGRSVGSGAAVDLATRKPLAGLILESPFLSAYRIVTNIPLFPFDKFNNFAKISHVRCPILILHGRQDATVPFWHSETLFRAANAPKQSLWVDNAGHNNLMEAAGNRYVQALREFVALTQRKQEQQRSPSQP